MQKATIKESTGKTRIDFAKVLDQSGIQFILLYPKQKNKQRYVWRKKSTTHNVKNKQTKEQNKMLLPQCRHFIGLHQHNIYEDRFSKISVHSLEKNLLDSTF